MKRLVALTILFLIASGLAYSFDSATIQDPNSSQIDLLIDEERNESNIQSFFDGLEEQPRQVSGLSFTDQGLRNPDARLEICGQVEEGETVNMYYTSSSNNITKPFLIEDVTVPPFNGSCAELDVDISSFEALFPGRPSAGIVNETSQPIFENQTVEDEDGNETTEEVQVGEEIVRGQPISLTETDGILKGNFNIGVTIFSERDQTGLEVSEVLDENNETVDYPDAISRELLAISIVDSEENVVDEASTSLSDMVTFDYSFSGGELIEVNSITALETKTIGECQTINESDQYYILNQSLFNQESSCIEVEDASDSVIDFANRTVGGNNNESKEPDQCGITVSNSDSISIQNPRVQQWDAGICTENSTNVDIQGVSQASGNIDGIRGVNSSLNLRDIQLDNEESDIIGFNNTQVNMSNVNFASGDVEGYKQDVRALSVEDFPPRPEELDEEKVRMDHFINVTTTGEDGFVEDLGFRFSLAEDNINPTDMFKWDLDIDEEDTDDNETENGDGNETSDEALTVDDFDIENLDTLRVDDPELIFHPEQRDDLSIFGLYGEVVEGEGPGEDEGDGADDADEGTDSPGGSEGPGAGTDPDPTPDPDPTAIELDLELEEGTVTAQQGETFSVEFTVSNVGEVDVENPFVDTDVRTGWDGGRVDFEEIEEEQTVEGEILVSVFDDEIPDTYEADFRAQSQNENIQDVEALEVDVELRQDLHSINIIEGPSFLDLPRGLEDEVELLVENNGDFDYEEITLEFRNAENCIAGVSGSHSLEMGEMDTLEYTVESEDVSEICVGVMVLESEDGQTLGIQPVQINLEDPTIVERLRLGLLPIILIIWTLITIVEGVKKYGGRTISRQKENRRR